MPKTLTINKGPEFLNEDQKKRLKLREAELDGLVYQPTGDVSRNFSRNYAEGVG